MLDTITTGHALRRSRELSGLSERAAARALGVRRATLRAWEADQATPDAEQIELATVVYGHGTEDVWAERAPLVDPEQPGLLVVGSERITVWSNGDAGQVDNRDVIARYLAAVRRQRGVEDHDDIALRADDLGALSMVLDLDDDELQSILMELLDLTPAGAQWAIRSMLVGGLVAMVATGALGSSWFAPNVSASPAEVRPPAEVAEVIVDDVVIDAVVEPAADAATDTTTDVSVPGVAVERGPEATEATEELITGDDVPVEVSETPLTIERDQWDAEQEALAGDPGEVTPPAPSVSLETGTAPATEAGPTSVERAATFDTGVTPQGRVQDRRSQGLPLFAVEHANNEVVVDPPVFSVHPPGAPTDLGAPLFAPGSSPQRAPGALGQGRPALPPHPGA
jgi:transcriptional regulator with XRE-family HTH domain